ncbi:MAG: VOC family protein, partial [Acidobacteriota bacterium]|nr:VOC family protein [Acidobacteriota bacterium]
MAMGYVCNYLNFNGDALEAFTFYAELFGTAPSLEVSRYRDMPAEVEMPALTDEDLDRVLHARVEILDGFVLMATDALASLGMSARPGNNVSISLQVEERAEADRLYDALSRGDESAPGMAEA